MPKRGLFVGRFQPVHNGHIKALEFVFSQVDEVIIGIGSAQASHTLKNPFTTSERMEMLIRALDEAGLEKRYYLIPLPDINFNAIWSTYVQSMVPRFDVVFTGNSLVAQLFRERGYEVIVQPMFRKDILSATEIRKRMVEGEPWEELVPKSVAEFIKEIKGVERIKMLATNLENSEKELQAPIRIPEF
ncbi:nicotinamide mononucleotide adenylyltransferase [Thermococcus onnurineus NA1]|uniref:Nicotinamide-nucleotide adenylyltransferase n=1 Tax=Thermococcus onnurineus (strain NA1) TaxID=523850 RepID=NADM_THEON|nr:nicotinamide-nucleotide adenylyltransferase [Thermococcus onnurineus]B6YX39.1 RecName: Full=Nicotinamide-nucleotide adenylyltransferase; AltName: Full=NAD(+) diphosphorylase; AltName: Full=NAD(+) pyrophosphorylase; AltName: Full=NMN adenylyltransferase [Thermococcus onnurineus NA1]ACJ16652.1 nicotinamide mononucleotide adenylyltransferase [Thermococcus onnurineus NA1]